jgi:hypothetical protein
VRAEEEKKITVCSFIYFEGGLTMFLNCLETYSFSDNCRKLKILRTEYKLGCSPPNDI